MRRGQYLHTASAPDLCVLWSIGQYQSRCSRRPVHAVDGGSADDRTSQRRQSCSPPPATRSAAIRLRVGTASLCPADTGGARRANTPGQPRGARSRPGAGGSPPWRRFPRQPSSAPGSTSPGLPAPSARRARPLRRAWQSVWPASRACRPRQSPRHHRGRRWRQEASVIDEAGTQGADGGAARYRCQPARCSPVRAPRRRRQLPRRPCWPQHQQLRRPPRQHQLRHLHPQHSPCLMACRPPTWASCS